jgi:hypothetical protein
MKKRYENILKNEYEEVNEFQREFNTIIKEMIETIYK